MIELHIHYIVVHSLVKFKLVLLHDVNCFVHLFQDLPLRATVQISVLSESFSYSRIAFQPSEGRTSYAKASLLQL